MKKLKINIINKSTNDLPQYITSGSAGMDVRAFCEDNNFIADKAEWDDVSKCVRIFPGGRALIHTGLYFELPEGYEIQVRPRSGLALKQGIAAHLGTLDSDYRGELGVILFNHSNESFEVKTGDRVAQLVVNKYEQAELNLVESLSETKRGDGGFGHTGKE